MKVLLVEDSGILGEAIRDHMMAMGHAVVWCATLGDAYAASGAGGFSVVLLDLRLPDGSGLSLLQALREARDMVPVVVLTAFDQISDQMEALRYGATDVLTKPFNLSRLSHCLQTING